MKSDGLKDAGDAYAFSIVLWFIFFMFLLFSVYINYNLKIRRSQREDTMFYKIYSNLMEIDPQFGLDKNYHQRHLVIEKITTELN